MFRNLLQLYAMLVCFIASIGMMIMIPGVGKLLLDLNYTESRHYESLAKYESNEKFINSYINSYDKKNYDFSQKSEKEITQMREQEREQSIRYKKNYAIEHIADNTLWIVSFMFFFIIHWVLYKKSSKQQN